MQTGTLVVKEGTKAIAGSAFSRCSGLTSVTIPNSVTSIGEEAFSGCSGLTAVHITDLSAWCNVRFSDYMSNPTYYAHHLYLNGEEIINLVIPEDVTCIGSFAFYECFAMKSVTVPNSVTSIGSYAFCNCSKLTKIDIPNSVTSIGEGTFAGCIFIKEVRCMASQPPAISEFSFSEKSYDRALLVVPDNSSNLYKNAEHWKNFKNVNLYIKADSITLDKKSVTMSEGETIMLSAILHPKNVIDQNIVWSSSDESVATVEDGNVTALRTGKTIITAKIEKVDTIISVPSTLVISNGADIYEWSQSADIQTLLKTPTTETLVFDLEAGGRYTLSNVVDFGHNKIILRTASKSNWATIVYGNDASIRFGGGFILSNINIDGNETIAPILGLSDNPNEAILGLNSHYIINDPVTIQNCNFYNVQRHFLHDNKRKYCVATFLMENVMVNFTSDSGMSSGSYFQIYDGGGFINDFTLRSCTFRNSVNKDGAMHDAKYFIRYSNGGRCDRAGFTKNSINMYNCTFYNIAKSGQMVNHGGFDGRKTSAYDIHNNIFVDCGGNQVPRRIVGRVGDASITIFNNNTYWFDGAAESGNTSYDSGYQLQSDPAFVDAANGNFTPTGAEQVSMQTGDPRWLISSAELATCEITVIPATGINGVICNDGYAAGNVYTVAGNLVCRKGEKLSFLPKGLYIVDGKKIVVN